MVFLNPGPARTGEWGRLISKRLTKLYDIDASALVFVKQVKDRPVLGDLFVCDVCHRMATLIPRSAPRR